MATGKYRDWENKLRQQMDESPSPFDIACLIIIITIIVLVILNPPS